MPLYAPDFDSLSSSGSIARASDGTFFLVDAFQHAVARIDKDLKVQWSIVKDEAPGLHYPTALEVHGQTIYVCDSWHHCIRKFDFMGNHLGDISQHGHETAQLECPADVKIDHHGNLWAVDTNHQALKVFAMDGTFQKAHSEPQLVANETLDPTRHFGIHSPLQSTRVPFYPQQVSLGKGQWACRDLEAISFFAEGELTPSFIFRSPEVVQWHLIGFMCEKLLIWSRATKELFAIHAANQMRIDFELPGEEALLCAGAGQSLVHLSKSGISITPLQDLKEKNRSEVFVFGDTSLPEPLLADDAGAATFLQRQFETITAVMQHILEAPESLLKPYLNGLSQRFPLDWFLPDYLFHPAGLPLKRQVDDVFHQYFNLLRQVIRHSKHTQTQALSQHLVEHATELIQKKLLLTAELTSSKLKPVDVFHRDWVLYLLDSFLFCLEGSLTVLRQSSTLNEQAYAVLNLNIPETSYQERFQFKLLTYLHKEQFQTIAAARAKLTMHYSDLLVDTFNLHGALEDLRKPLSEGHTLVARQRMLWLARLHLVDAELGLKPAVNLSSIKVVHFCFLAGESQPVERFAKEIPALEDTHGNAGMAWSVFNYMTMNTNNAKKTMEHLIQEHPQQAQFRAQMAQWSLEWGDQKTAKNLLSETQKSPHFAFYQAYFHFHAADLNAFQTVYKNHHELQGSLCEKLFCLAMSAQNKDLAQRSFALDSQKDSRVITHRKHLLGGLYHMLEGNFDAAEAMLQTLPYQPLGKHFFLAILHRYQNHQEKAMAHIRQELLAMSTFPARIQKALICMENDKALFEEIVQNLPDYAWVYDQNQRVARRQGTFTQVLNRLRETEQKPWQDVNQQQRLDYLKTILFLNLFKF